MGYACACGLFVLLGLVNGRCDNVTGFEASGTSNMNKAELIEKLALDRLLVVPAADPPHKALAAGSPTPEERLELTRLAMADLPWVQVLDLELRRAGKSYTSDTLRALAGRYPGQPLYLIMGTDMFLSLLQWHEPEVITALASVAVFSRQNGLEEDIERMARKLRQEHGATVYIIPGAPVEVSSTEVRNLLAERKGRDKLPAAVYSEIIRNRFYGAKPELEWLRKKAYSYLKPKRVAHVRGVEQEAVRLAERWGVFWEDAAEAAICHDITKKYSHEDQLRLCARYGIIADDYERSSEKLLHARTGAALAGEIFGLSENVLSAIRWHTTGRAGMTDLERITYLADYIEPNRSGFPGLSELRATCYEDLDAAMELAMRMSLDEVRGRGQEPHNNTREGWLWYRRALLEKGVSPVHAEGVPDDFVN